MRLTDVAFDVHQVRVVRSPRFTDAGLALKLWIDGACTVAAVLFPGAFAAPPFMPPQPVNKLINNNGKTKQMSLGPRNTAMTPQSRGRIAAGLEGKSHARVVQKLTSC